MLAPFRRSLPLAPLAFLIAVAASPALAQGPEDAAAVQGNIDIKALIGDSVSDPGDARYSDVAEAVQRFRNRDQLAARTLLERAVQKNPKLPPVGVLLAKLQLLSGNAAGVRPALEQAVQEDSASDPEPYLLLAEEALAGQRTIEAEALFDKAVELIDAYDANAKRQRQFKIRAFQGRAVIAQRRSNWAKAEADLRALVAEDPESAVAQNSLGQVLFMYQEDAKDREGFQFLNKAKELSKDLPSPYVSAAMLYLRNGKNGRAMEAFEKAARESGEELSTLVPYAQALMQGGQLEKAATVLEKARGLSGDSHAAWLLSGVAARMSGDPAAAEKFLMQALALAPANRDVLNQLSLALLESPEKSGKARAQQFAQLNQQVNPNNPDINVTLAWVLFQNGDARNATAALRQGLQGGALSPGGSFLLAKVLLARDDKENAKRLLESALKNDQGIFVERKEAETLLGTL